MEIQQSPLYAKYIKTLKWTVESVDGTNIFIRSIPLTGTIAKIQRPVKLPDTERTIEILKKYNVRFVVAEADSPTSENEFIKWCNELKKHFTLSSSPYIPTKTIHVNLTLPEEDIFKSFTSAKRRAIRRAIHLGVTVEESDDINTLVAIKNKSAGLFGFITTYGMAKLWPIFAPDNATILLAYGPVQRILRPHAHKELIGGILLLFWDNIAYYWLVGATKQGKKLFAPTLLVWHALQVSKKRGMENFDFVGVWDERLPGQFDSWKGFTKFKEGFGGKTIYYPLAIK